MAIRIAHKRTFSLDVMLTMLAIFRLSSKHWANEKTIDFNNIYSSDVGLLDHTHIAALQEQLTWENLAFVFNFKQDAKTFV